MASLTPRASGFWTDSTRMNYFEGEGGDDIEQSGQVYDQNDGRTALDRTIDRIGMGSYQWTLLSLCGFGWLADNMWIEAVAIMLPRVQQHYSVPNTYIGAVSSSMFAGMMFGAVGWGTCSDLMGRITAFNATLFFTSLFGVLAAFANSFLALCIVLFFLGSAVGGSMPTDGTLLLEHMPKGKQYLVTALSVFFSFGSVLAAVVALLIVPQYSCPPAPAPCDMDKQNQGWKYMLVVLGLITLVMFIARILFFRLHESPRYLVHAGRHQEAIVALQNISRFNGSEIELDLEDVDDLHRAPPPEDADDARAPFLAPARPRGRLPDFDQPPESTTIFDAEENAQPYDDGTKDYQSTTDSPNSLDSQSVKDASRTPSPPISASHLRPPRPRPSPSTRHSRASLLRRSSVMSMPEVKSKVGSVLPRWIKKPLWAWLDRVAMVLSPEWLRTTILVWIVWIAMALAYTMFNVFLPKLLETRTGSANSISDAKTLEDSLWDVVIFTLGGCPGALLGAYMIESRLGRRWSLAGSTFVTAVFCLLFVTVESPLAVRASTVGISLSSTAMYAVLYGWTPEIFGTKVRGTACGIASALSRIGGMIAPLLGGMLLMLNQSFPVYASAVIFIFAGLCVLLLKEDAGEGGRSAGDRVVVH